MPRRQQAEPVMCMAVKTPVRNSLRYSCCVHRFRCCCKPGTVVVNAGILLADDLNLHSVLLLQLQAISFLSLSFPFFIDIIRQ